jgi:hypothetical protein
MFFSACFAPVFEGEIEAACHILLHPCRNADPAGLGQAFEAGGDIDAVAKDIAVLGDDVALVNADAELDPPFPRHRVIGFGHCRLHFGGASHRIDDAGELEKQTVAGGLDDAAVMTGDLGIDQLGTERLEPSQRAFLVGFDQARITRDISGQDRREPTFDAGLP